MISTFSPFNFVWPRFWPISAPPSQPALRSLDELQEQLQSPEFSFEKLESMKESLKVLIRSDHVDNQRLQQAIEKIISWGFTTSDPIRVFTLLSEAFALDKLIGVIRHKTAHDPIPFTSIDDWATQRVDLYQAQYGAPAGDNTLSQRTIIWKRILYFIPNMINFLINTLSYVDIHRKFTSLWDRFAIIDILYKFVLVPYALVKLLTPVLVVPTRVYLATACIIAGIGLSVAAYKKWVMPVPDEILNCENLDKQMELGVIEPKVGEPPELARMVSALLSGSHVLLVGKSGCGKTALMERYVQLKKEGKLPKELQGLHNFAFDCSALLGTYSYGFFETLYQTGEQIRGNEKNITLLVDELGQIAENPSCMEAFKYHLLREGGPRLVAATTPGGYQKIIQAVGGSFGRRVQQIWLSPPEEKMVSQVLWDYLRREAADLPVGSDCVPRLIQVLRQNPGYSPDIGEIAKAKKLLKEAIGRCRCSFTADYASPELAQLRNEYEMIRGRVASTFSHNQADVTAAHQLRGRITQAESELAAYKATAKKIQNFVNEQTKLKKRYSHLLQKVASSGTQEPTDDVKKLYLLYEFYGINAFQKGINEEIDRLRQLCDGAPTANLHIKIDAASIDKIFAESASLEETLRG